jgi:hypothetical protein
MLAASRTSPRGVRTAAPFSMARPGQRQVGGDDQRAGARIRHDQVVGGVERVARHDHGDQRMVGMAQVARGIEGTGVLWR